jgi:hypothetical protein
MGLAVMVSGGAKNGYSWSSHFRAFLNFDCTYCQSICVKYFDYVNKINNN